MKEELYRIEVTSIEQRIIVKALQMLKDYQITNKKNYDFIDDLIVKTCEAQPVQSRKKKIYEER